MPQEKHLQTPPPYRVTIMVPAWTQEQANTIMRQVEQMFAGFTATIAKVDAPLPMPKIMQPPLPAPGGAPVVVPTPEPARAAALELPKEFFRDADSGAVVQLLASDDTGHRVKDHQTGHEWAVPAELFASVYEKFDPSSPVVAPTPQEASSAAGAAAVSASGDEPRGEGAASPAETAVSDAPAAAPGAVTAAKAKAKRPSKPRVRKPRAAKPKK